LTAYPSEWSDLFVATAGAAAALAGLVFVAVSINIDRILKLTGLPERALETVLLLLLVLLVSIVALIPGQGHAALGVELLGLAPAAATLISRLGAIRSAGAPQIGLWTFARWALRTLAVLPFLLGGLAVRSKEAAGFTGWRPGSSSRSSEPSPMPGSSWSRSCAERMSACADPTNGATPSSPTTNAT
jgi:hypothetical protein